MSLTMVLQLDTQAAAQAAYETHAAYTRTSGLTPAPAFATLSQPVQEAWRAIARAAFAHVSQEPAKAKTGRL